MNVSRRVDRLDQQGALGRVDPREADALTTAALKRVAQVSGRLRKGDQARMLEALDRIGVAHGIALPPIRRPDSFGDLENRLRERGDDAAGMVREVARRIVAAEVGLAEARAACDTLMLPTPPEIFCWKNLLRIDRTRPLSLQLVHQGDRWGVCVLRDVALGMVEHVRQHPGVCGQGTSFRVKRRLFEAAELWRSTFRRTPYRVSAWRWWLVGVPRKMPSDAAEAWSLIRRMDNYVTWCPRAMRWQTVRALFWRNPDLHVAAVALSAVDRRGKIDPGTDVLTAAFAAWLRTRSTGEPVILRINDEPFFVAPDPFPVIATRVWAEWFKGEPDYPVRWQFGSDLLRRWAATFPQFDRVKLGIRPP